MTYEEFADRFLAALYLETEDSGQEYHSIKSLLGKYNLAPKPHWISRIADDWEHTYFRDVSRVLGGFDGWDFRISAEGARKVEADFRDEDEIREFLGVGPSSNSGSAQINDEASAEIVPAADRIVRLDHNEPEYREIAEGLNTLLEEVRQNNEIGETAGERDRILRSLTAAREFWAAAELRIIQIRIGVVMAVEDATQALVKVGKEVGKAALVDLILAFVKRHTGIDL